jgi:hypothetical protein
VTTSESSAIISDATEVSTSTHRCVVVMPIETPRASITGRPTTFGSGWGLYG